LEALKSREDFIKILNELVEQLNKISRSQVVKSKDYISGLLFLYGKIKQINDKNILLQIAISGKFKGIKTKESELHVELLKTLATNKVAGKYGFWVNQLLDDSNKYYACPAFWALKDHLEKLFDHIAIFIDKFYGEIELTAGIILLISKYGREKIAEKFRAAGPNLSAGQKEAVNEAFLEAGYDEVYKVKGIVLTNKELQYKLSVPRLQYISISAPEYERTSIKQKAARIFRLMGYNAEFGRCFGRYTIDVFIKKKKCIGNKYECWLCFFDEGNRKRIQDVIKRVFSIRDRVRQELKKESEVCENCHAVIIAEKGFTKKAIAAAKDYGIELITLNQLVSDLEDFKTIHKRLIRDFEALCQKEGQI
jgi:hypothetical protein